MSNAFSFLPNSAAAANVVADGAYAVQVTAPPALAPYVASDVLAIVGGFRNGKPNVPIGPIVVSSQSGMGPVLAAVGDGVVNGSHIPYDGVREATSATPETTAFIFVRVTDGTETAATLSFVDNTGFASQTYTLGGAWATGKELSIILTPIAGNAVTATYTTGTNGDTSLATAATNLLAAVNASTAVTGPNAFIQPATLSGDIITVTSLVSGTASNAIGTTTNTPTGLTLVAGDTTMSGGAAPGVVFTITLDLPGTENNGTTAVATLQSGSLTASPIFTVTLAVPYNGQQTWIGIVGYATAGDAYDATTFQTNICAAINGTASGQTGSTLATAATGSSTEPPLLNATLTASGGTDGVAGLDTVALIGTDGITGRTGLYALRGVGFGGVLLAECTDPTIDTVIEAFLEQVGGLGFTGFASGTATDTAVQDKSNYNLSNPRIVRCIDWEYAPDTLAGQTSDLVSPLGGIAGVHLSLNPWDDPSNKPEGVTKGNCFGTERTVGPNLSSGLPFTNPVDPQTEGATRKTNGFQYLTNGQPRTGGLIGLAHGKTSSGANVSDIRMYDYIAASVLTILQQYVGQNQTPPPATGQFDTDAIRNAIRGDFLKLEQTMLGNSGSEQQVAAIGFQFTGTAQQVAAGYCPWSVQGQTLAGIEFAIADIAVGTDVTVAAND